jgi:ADP-heptose:LPS heptosyltransferase
MEHLKGNEPFIFNMAGETTLRELAVLCERAELFVGNESGPMHFANISGTPLIALFGPGVKDVFYPYGEKSRVIHHVDVDIAGRMEKITVEEVSRAIEELLTTQ